MTIVVSILIGLLGGILGGLFGIGGGVILVPAMVYLLGFSQHKAQGTSLLALLAPVGLLGVLEYYKAGNIDLKIGALLAAGFFVGAFFGSRFSLSLDEVLLRRLFAGFLVLLAANLVLQK